MLTGLSFWFQPLSTALMEIPIDNRELPFLFHARSRDFQDVTVQGVINLRIDEPDRLAERIDFSIDTGTGLYTEAPLDKLAALVTELAQQFTLDHLLQMTLPEILEAGFESVRLRIEEGLRGDSGLSELGLGIADGPYASMFYAITGTFVALLILGMLVSVVAAFRFLGGRTGDHEILVAHSIVWYAITAVYCGVWFLVYVTK